CAGSCASRRGAARIRRSARGGPAPRRPARPRSTRRARPVARRAPRHAAASAASRRR
ncbi:MAG: hypothetical protein AVDCRST_MAG38-1934, partial [uncultured Solirubrobacteraceae bacterium]